MKRLLIIAMVFLWTMCIQSSALETRRWGYERDPKPNEVAIWETGVAVPVGHILLVRRKSEYCAVKFTAAWKGKNRYDNHARYVSFFPSDRKRGFSQDNLKAIEGELHYRPVNWGGCHFVIGDSGVRCGSFALVWGYPTFLLYLEPGEQDHHLGIEIAPTKWTDIKEVNLSDPRIKWYEFEERRDAIYIPIDDLWTERGEIGKEMEEEAN